MTPNKLADCIYDVLCELSMSDAQDDAYAQMKRKFANESKKDLHRYLKNKYMSIEAGHIEIGERKPIVIKLS
jgi:UDP:flavonoid glycosyltransferase YjiC (YdhE family)